MCRALPSTKLAPVRQAFEALFREFGLPDRIRSDNGVPFASAGVGRLSRLSVYWMTLGIEVERTRPGHPQDNGITFTFGGLRINLKGEVLNTENHIIPGLYAAGELVGGLFYYNYPGGSGLMAGAVFGHLAGSEAARHALQSQHQ